MEPATTQTDSAQSANRFQVQADQGTDQWGKHARDNHTSSEGASADRGATEPGTIGIDCLDSPQKAHSLLLKIIDPLRRHYSPGNAGLLIGDTSAGYPQRVVPMEAFARPLWGLVPFWAGGGRDSGFESLYAKGIAAGVDPDDTEFWGGCTDRDQRFVEMAALAYGLLFAPEQLWAPLDELARANLAAWLYQINEHELPDSNWNLFGVLVNLALKARGCRFSQQKIDHGLARIEAFHLGKGWYRDGHSYNKDYYTSFAIHFYCLVYARVAAADDPARAALFRARAVDFAREFICWFEDGGAALPFGRSLTYRFAQASFWGACLFADVQPFPIGVLKGLILRNLVDWFHAPILDRAGILSIGYRYPNLHMSEGYNAPGSPYWALKTFIVLALPASHTFWSAAAEPLPALPALKHLEHAEMLIQRRPADVVAYVPGRHTGRQQVHDPAKYSKFAYSTQFGFSVPRTMNSLAEAAPDSMLAFEINGYVFVRRRCEDFVISDTEVFSHWSPFPGIDVRTSLIPTQDGHIRRHEVRCDYACVAHDCGFAVAVQEGEAPPATARTTHAFAGNDTACCEVFSILGDGSGEVIAAEANTNLIHPKTLIPAIRYALQPGITHLETLVTTHATR